MPKLSDLVAPFNAKPFSHQTISIFQRGVPVGESADLDRIVALPRRPQLLLDSPRAEALVELITSRYARENKECHCAQIDPKRSCITRLLPIQAWALYEIGLANGLLGAIPVGYGKTIIGLLTPFAIHSKTALLLVPPSLLDQLVLDYQLLSQHFRVPSIIVHENIYYNIIPNTPSLHVLPYSRLSLPTSSDWVERLNPDVVIADECDRLKDLRNSAGTRRIMRYYSNHGDTRFCGWTGSLSDHSIEEFFHLSALALRYSSPLPLETETAKDWGRALDAVPNPAPAGALLALCTPGETARSGFRRRFAETLGIITCDSAAVEVEGQEGQEVNLIVREREAPPIPPEVQSCLDQVRNFVRPDGEELVDALSVAKCAAEVACGLYYRWIFPRGEPAPLILEWLEARKDWNKELRRKLMPEHHEQYLDSPHLCEIAAQRAYGHRAKRDDRPEWKATTYPRWWEVKDKVKPKTQAVRIHDYLVQDAAQWGRENRGIIWYSMVEFGAWIAEVSGLTMHTGGVNAGALIRRETGDRSILASIKSHGRGRDGLQRLYDRQLVANVPASATAWQQLLARMHRRGQKSEQVTTDIYRHTQEFRKSFDQALRRAEYVKGTLGASQKLLGAWKE